VSCNVDHLPFQLWVTSLPHVPEGGSPATTRTRFAYVKELAIATPSTSAQRTAIETSKKFDVVVMDKTGTLTLGAPQVTDLIVDGMPETDALALIAAGAARRHHGHCRCPARCMGAASSF